MRTSIPTSRTQYAYWVRMRYVIPMSVISIHDYVSLERDIDLLNTLDPIYWDLEDPSDLNGLYRRGGDQQDQRPQDLRTP